MSEPRKLDRPPSERYGAPPEEQPQPAPGGTGPLDRASPERGVAFGLIGGAIAAAILAVFGGAFSYTAGLLVIAFFLGRIVGYTVRAGSLETLSSSARVSVAVVVSIAATTVAQLAIWIWAQTEGGTLSFGDFLVQTFGPLVPLEYMIATLAAWWSAR